MKLQIFKSCSGFRSHKRPRDSEYFHFVPRASTSSSESRSRSHFTTTMTFIILEHNLCFFLSEISSTFKAYVCILISEEYSILVSPSIVWKQKSDVKQKPNTENSLLFFFSSSNIDVSYFSSLWLFFILFFFLFLIYRYLSFLACFIFILRFFYIYQVLSVSLGVDIRSYYSQRVYPLSIPIYVCNVKEASFSQ